MAKAKESLTLLTTFLKIGVFTFGGGYAMIPLIQREVVEQHHWLTQDDLLDIIAIAESTPGPIAINAATFVGVRVAGMGGACAATLGVVLPSFLIILGLSFVLKEFQAIPAVQYAFRGIRAGVLALILKALLSMYRQCPKSPLAYGLMGAAFLSTAVLGVSSLVVILGCACVGLLWSLLLSRRSKL